jgi:hypothetical protein
LEEGRVGRAIAGANTFHVAHLRIPLTILSEQEIKR